MLEINVLLKQRRYKEAAIVAEMKIFCDIAIMQTYFIKLVDIDLLLNEADVATCVADISQKMVTALGLWEYSRYVCPLQIAVAAKDIPGSIELIKAMLKVAPVPRKEPVMFRHLPTKPIEEDFGLRVVAVMLHQFETDKDYEFLRSNSDFQNLIAKYKKQFPKKE